MAAPDPGLPPLTRAELVASLSLATDLGMGQPVEQGLRTCLLAVVLATRLGLSEDEVRATYYASLLRFIGCNAERQLAATYFGDEVAFGPVIGPVSQGSQGEMMSVLVRSTGAGRSMTRRLQLVASVLATGGGKFAAASRAHCEVGTILAQRLGFERRIQEALLFAFERWDGKGMPNHARGDQIPIEMRVAQAAKDIETFNRLGGRDGAVEIAARRSGHALDPTVAAAFLDAADETLDALDVASTWDEVIALEPGTPTALDDTGLDVALRAVADLVDLQSPYLSGHSAGVAGLASDGAAAARLPIEDVETLRLAGYLHDLGRVVVSVALWEKPGALTQAEWETVRLHPHYTQRVLSRTPRLRRLGELASSVHERVDGSGYHRALPAALQSRSTRILAAADVYRALAEPRPHRPAMDRAGRIATVRGLVRDGQLDGDAVEAVLEAAGGRGRKTRREWPAGLTDREVDVLRLVARGLTTKGIAEDLVISGKTADNHIQHIYTKLGVSTRAAATLFAIQHDLLDPP